MSKRTLTVLIVGCLLSLMLIASLAWFARNQRQTIASAKSPDGSWSVAVIGQKLLAGFGGVEIYVEVRDADDRPLPGAYVIGIATDWPSARRGYSAVACGNAQAVVNGQTILKSRYLP